MANKHWINIKVIRIANSRHNTWCIFAIGILLDDGGYPLIYRLFKIKSVRVMLTMQCKGQHMSDRMYGIRKASAYIHFASFVCKSDVLQTIYLINMQCSTNKYIGSKCLYNCACTFLWNYSMHPYRAGSVYTIIFFYIYNSNAW